MTLKENYLEFIKTKNDFNLLKIRLKKVKSNEIIQTINEDLEIVSNKIIELKNVIKQQKAIRAKELINKYNIKEYYRSDNQFKNLAKLETDDVYTNILEDTSFFKGDIQARMLVLTLGLTKDDVTCESKDCTNIKCFNRSTNYFKTFCHISHTDEIQIQRNKATITLEKKYGVTNQNQIKDLVRNNKVPHIFKDTHPAQQNILNFENYNKEYVEEHFSDDINNMCSYFNIHINTAYVFYNKNNIKYKKGSKIETEIYEYVLSLTSKNNIEVLKNNRKIIAPLELDIVIPELKISIEYNGLYWHSYGLNNVNDNQNNLRFNKIRHLDKTNIIEEKGYQLFHIFENEWRDPRTRQIWKSQISNALKANTVKVGARKCIIQKVQKNVADDFLERNHLQGKCQSSINLGLYYKGELISLMTFGASRYDKSVDYELIRFCSKLFVQVPGAASRLLKYFELKYNPKGLVSYANRRWSKGHLYETLKFDKGETTNANYFYYNVNSSNPILYSRVKFQKHKLEKVLDTFDADKTEMQNMIENNYRAIYDAGNHKFTKSYKIK